MIIHLSIAHLQGFLVRLGPIPAAMPQAFTLRRLAANRRIVKDLRLD